MIKIFISIFVDASTIGSENTKVIKILRSLDSGFWERNKILRSDDAVFSKAPANGTKFYALWIPVSGNGTKFYVPTILYFRRLRQSNFGVILPSWWVLRQSVLRTHWSYFAVLAGASTIGSENTLEIFCRLGGCFDNRF